MGSLLHSQEGLIHTDKGPLVLLFFDGFDLKARDGALGKVKSQLHHQLRNHKRALYKQQPFTGFYTAFLGLVKSLEAIGCDVRVNDFKTAKLYPDYPIGVAGYPSVLDHIFLPNPKIFGPGDFGLPDDSQRVANDDSYKKLIQPCEWFTQVYKPYCGDKMVPWFAGIDCDGLQDLSQEQKQYDFLIYDKIRWHREEQVPAVLNRIKQHLRARGLTYTEVRYGQHHISEFIDGLKKSKSMLFVCEHETQGLACQEALASNIPVLTWEEERIIDPELEHYNAPNLNVSSVPYFDQRCGMKFKIEHFEYTCDAFVEQHEQFKPRQFVLDTLALDIAGRNYLHEYQSISHSEC
ncbi:glycosyltransferase family 1 protein [Vibrio paucivorans]|uniref:Glycosyltransferase family 1 protein n=1 Tax=Vibrio paucivorans TaxID=2829489 RepID=A0A9X3CHM7_9VIBR|nr:glycosyltransferase family 1 protein [Vibrio paucivorans]MCW8336063.1 glycosyltransferase family 1 protein [Vibrio paucivorans]